MDQCRTVQTKLTFQMTTFLETYRKGQSPEQTHFCPGCGHGNMLRFVDEAICKFGVEDKAVWVSPVGCGGLTDSYLSISHILAAHGRASAVATAFKRLHPDAIVIVSQGDGDLASIGLLEAIHAANRGENLTVFFMNNANFAMTGGQMAPTTLVGQKTSTSPEGRRISEHGEPIRMCELLNTLEGPAFIARVAIGSERQILDAQRTICKAIENQIQGKGYSFVEILSPCPSNWHCTPEEARDRTANEMTAVFPLGVFRDVSKEAILGERLRPVPYDPAMVSVPYEALAKPMHLPENAPFCLDGLTSICCAGFGGQGVLTLGKIMARLALASHLEVTWIPSYGPEMRGGTANCFVRMDRHSISSPVVEVPDVVIALNQPALDVFGSRVAQTGIVLYDSDSAQPKNAQKHQIGIPAISLANACESPRSANLVLLGAWLKWMSANTEAVRQVLEERLAPNQMAAVWAGMDAF